MPTDDECKPNSPPKRCHKKDCNKRLGLMVFKCNCCEEEFCVKHRIPEEHNCDNNYRLIAHVNNMKKVMCDAITDNHNYVSI